VKKILVPADDLLHLIHERDAWAGAMHTDDVEPWRNAFKDLRKKAEVAYKQSTGEEWKPD